MGIWRYGDMGIWGYGGYGVEVGGIVSVGVPLSTVLCSVGGRVVYGGETVVGEAGIQLRASVLVSPFSCQGQTRRGLGQGIVDLLTVRTLHIVNTRLQIPISQYEKKVMDRWFRSWRWFGDAVLYLTLFVLTRCS